MFLENSQVYFNEGPITLSLPSLLWIFAPCFIGLWSIYNKSLILLLWAFIRMHLEFFQPFVSNMGLQCIHHLWAFHFYSLFHPFFFSWNSPLARIHCSLHLKVYEIFIILGLGMQQRDPRLGSFIFGFEGCWMLSPLFQKGFFHLGLW